jgi:hypothetical protein
MKPLKDKRKSLEGVVVDYAEARCQEQRQQDARGAKVDQHQESELDVGRISNPA